MAITKESIAVARKAGKEVGPCAVAARYRPSAGGFVKLPGIDYICGLRVVILIR